MQKLFEVDERTERINGKVAFIFLMITQIALGIALVYQAYILDIDSAFHNDISLILLISAYGYWAARLYFSGVLPRFTWQQLLGIYVAFVAIIVIPTVLIHGLPAQENLARDLLPPFLGPALIIGIYILIAYLGRWRLEKDLQE